MGDCGEGGRQRVRSALASFRARKNGRTAYAKGVVRRVRKHAFAHVGSVGDFVGSGNGARDRGQIFPAARSVFIPARIGGARAADDVGRAAARYLDECENRADRRCDTRRNAHDLRGDQVRDRFGRPAPSRNVPRLRRSEKPRFCPRLFSVRYPCGGSSGKFVAVAHAQTYGRGGSSRKHRAVAWRNDADEQTLLRNRVAYGSYRYDDRRRNGSRNRALPRD